MNDTTPVTLRTRIRVRLWLWRWWVERHLPRLYAGWRYLCGARRPYMGEDTCGTYGGPGVWVPFGGACPVQGTGEVDGFGVYYRARGESWSLDVYDCEIEGNDLPGDEHQVWSYHRREYVGYAGGWIDHRESRRNIEIAVKRFREWRLTRESA